MNMEQQQQPLLPGKKKRVHAQQGYDFGGNHNLQTPLGGVGGGMGAPVPMAEGRPHQIHQDQLANQFGHINLQQGPEYSQSGYEQPGYPQPGYPQTGYQQPGYQQSGYQQPGYQQPGYPQAGNPQQPAYQTGPPNSSGFASVNDLKPVDLNQYPFSATDLDIPPPAINLPPNSSITGSPYANASPKYIRSTLNAVPRTHSILKKSKLPFALVISPYIALHDHEENIPVISDSCIARCRRCRSYINPFVSFIDHGHRWRCNMCNLTNDTPRDFDWNPVIEQVAQKWDRAELNHSVVDFIAPQEYMLRPPQPLIYVFILDISANSINNGLLATAARSILQSLDRIPNAKGRLQVAFLAVDASLHYFVIPPDDNPDGQAQILVVSDLANAFTPRPIFDNLAVAEDLVVNLRQRRKNIEKLLENLHVMFKDNHVPQCAMGPALEAALLLIKSCGGKITVLTSTLPNLGVGKLESREDPKLFGTSKESNLLVSSNGFYKALAIECSKAHVSVDMFLFSAQYQDVATLACLPRYTGGQTYFYLGWHASKTEDAVKFASELETYLSTEIGLEAVLRVRATTGLRMQSFFGNFFNRSSDLCAFAAIPRDQSYVVEVAIDEALTKPVVCLQTAILHTSCNDERRIRVITLALPVTGNLSNVFASADPQAIACYYSHKAVDKTLSSGLEETRDAIQDKLVEILRTYLTELAGGNSVGIQLPVNLRALPALFLGLMKHIGFRRSTNIPSDIRSAAICLLSSLPLPLLIQYIYPRMYSLHDILDDPNSQAGMLDEVTNEMILPPVLNLSSEKLVSYGLYLIDNGQNQFLWLGKDAIPALVNDMFGEEDKIRVQQGKITLRELDNPMNERVRAVIEGSRSARSNQVGSIFMPSLHLIREDGELGLQMWAQSMLVEDHFPESGHSLVQWTSLLAEKAREPVGTMAGITRRGF